MPRPTVRTTQLLRDHCDAMRSLFGTARNAYQRLRLEDTRVSFVEFQRALSWSKITADTRDTIVLHWQLWGATYLSSTAPADTTFTLPLSTLE